MEILRRAELLINNDRTAKASTKYRNVSFLYVMQILITIPVDYSRIKEPPHMILRS